MCGGPCRLPHRGGVKKIVELRREARGDLGKQAECILAALGNEAQQTDAEFIRAATGAMLIADLMQHVKLIKNSLTKSK